MYTQNLSANPHNSQNPRPLRKVRKSATVPAPGTSIYYGIVYFLGKEFNSSSKTVLVHGHLGEVKPQFLKDLFIAKIFLTDIETTALPENAMIKDGESNYIYVVCNQNDAREIQFAKSM